MDQQRREDERREGGANAYEAQKQRRKQVQDARYNMYVNKLQGAAAVKNQVKGELQRKQQFDMQDKDSKAMKRETIRQMVAKSKNSVQDFQNQKIETAKAEGRDKVNYEK